MAKFHFTGLLFAALVSNYLSTLYGQQNANWKEFRCRSFSISYPPNLSTSSSTSDSVAFQSLASYFTIDISFLSSAPPEQEELLAEVAASIRASAAQEGATVSISSPEPTAYGDWIGKRLHASLRRGGQGREISATVIPSRESAYLIRVMTPPQSLAEAEAVWRQMAHTLVLSAPTQEANAYTNEPSAAKYVIGKWAHSDSGGTLEYQFLPNGSFRYEGVMHASGYPTVSINSFGTYQVSGASIVVNPASVMANGIPGSIVRSSGRYDSQNDRIILWQQSSQVAVVFVRAR